MSVLFTTIYTMPETHLIDINKYLLNNNKKEHVKPICELAPSSDYPGETYITLTFPRRHCKLQELNASFFITQNETQYSFAPTYVPSLLTFHSSFPRFLSEKPLNQFL